MIRRADVRWALSTIALAPMAAVVYFVFEWLFFVTKPSPLSALRFGTQAVVLLKSPLAIMRPLVAVQALASAVAAIGYPRLRGIAVVPAALVLGLLCLVLVDNFTYTIFGFGVL